MDSELKPAQSGLLRVMQASHCPVDLSSPYPSRVWPLTSNLINIESNFNLIKIENWGLPSHQLHIECVATWPMTARQTTPTKRGPLTRAALGFPTSVVD